MLSRGPRGTLAKAPILVKCVEVNLPLMSSFNCLVLLVCNQMYPSRKGIILLNYIYCTIKTKNLGTHINFMVGRKSS